MPGKRRTARDRSYVTALRKHTKMTMREISATTSVSLTTVQRWCVQIKEAGKPATPTKPRGRKKLCDTGHRQRLIRYITADSEGRRASYRELRAICPFSSRTIRRRLHFEGFRRCVAIAKPLLTEDHKLQRLQWALEHVN